MERMRLVYLYIIWLCAGAVLCDDIKQPPVSWGISNQKAQGDLSVGKEIMNWALQMIQQHQGNQSLSQMNYTVTLNISVRLFGKQDSGDDDEPYQRTGESLSIVLLDNNTLKRYEWQETHLVTLNIDDEGNTSETALAEILYPKSPVEEKPKVNQTAKAGFSHSCEDLQKLYQSSGIYLIHVPIPGKNETFWKAVYCDFKTDGGGWTMIQRRQLPSPVRQDFDKNWEWYEYGFGNLTDSFWIGLNSLWCLTQAEDQELRIELTDWDNQKVVAKYAVFKIGDKHTKYQLSIGNYSGNAGDSFSTHNGLMFSTHDKDNDKASHSNCASGYASGWWFDACYEANLNGKYLPTKYGKGIAWEAWHGGEYSLKHVEMKMRSRQFRSKN